MTDCDKADERARSDEEIADLTSKLNTLLQDPHPGLFTWVSARNGLAKKLRDALSERLGDTPAKRDPVFADLHLKVREGRESLSMYINRCIKTAQASKCDVYGKYNGTSFVVAPDHRSQVELDYGVVP